MTVPLPPEHVGPGGYLDEGRAVRERLERMLPAGWDWTGTRTLDFGCGSGRVLRHLPGETEAWGCDIHAESIAWIRANLPSVRVFVNAYTPPLEVEAGTFDLVYATSVFTHIGEHWSGWLWEALLGEPYAEDEVGMTVRHGHTAEDAWVFHSEWWLREHWGRAFEVVDVWRPPAGEVTHGYVTLRRRDHHGALAGPREPGAGGALGGGGAPDRRPRGAADRGPGRDGAAAYAPAARGAVASSASPVCSRAT